MQPFKRGAFHLAREASVPVVPIALIGSYQILPRQKWLPNWGYSAEIRIGEPITFGRVRQNHLGKTRRRTTLMQEAEHRVWECLLRDLFYRRNDDRILAVTIRDDHNRCPVGICC